ncbi:unnamed protein product [Prorocentrum cordatum]|uniref:PH domain-containing protein n=1 Tax=Prorocentrum cordatum TaxID=2364126 RepID=A0ABN9S043_9DINO|nr:unnamed protein product [Polarella glacialis]
MEMHVRHDELNPVPHHHARLASLAAREQLSAAEFAMSQRVHKSAGRAKHNVSRIAMHAAAQSGAPRARDDQLSFVASSVPSADAPAQPCGRLLARRWRHGQTRLRRDAAVFHPSEVGCIPTLWAHELSEDLCDHGVCWADGLEGDTSWSFCSSPAFTLPPYVPSVCDDDLFLFNCYDAGALGSAAQHIEYCRRISHETHLWLAAIEQKSEKQFQWMRELEDMISTIVPIGSLVQLRERSDKALHDLEEQSVEAVQLLDYKIQALREEVVGSQRLVVDKVDCRFSRIPDLARFEAKAVSVADALRTDHARVEAAIRLRRDHIESFVQSGVAECRSVLAAETSKLKAMVVDPSAATVERWVRRPLDRLWDDCQLLVDSHCSKVKDFLSSTRELILMESHAVFHGFSADVPALRDSAALVQDFRGSLSLTSDLKVQVVAHEQALHELAALAGSVVSQNTDMISNAVDSTFKQLVESDIMCTAVRAELARSAVRDVSGRDRVRVGGLVPAAAASSSSSGSLLDDDEWCGVCGGRRSHAFSRLPCACLLEEEGNWST